MPLATLLSQAYADERRKLIGERASMELRPGDICGAPERMRRVLAMAGKETPIGPGGGEPTFAPLPPEWGDTVHLDVVDAAGNMISATPSGGWLQGSPVVPGLGFPISTRGQMCWLEDGHPTTLRPRTRPRITLSPTLVTREGEPYLAIGTPGGDQQEQWTLSVFLRLVHHRMSLQQAIDAPMFQTEAHGAVVPSAPVRAGPRRDRGSLPGRDARRTGKARPSAHRRGTRGRSGACARSGAGTDSCAPPRRRG